jgi:hypothetical protein
MTAIDFPNSPTVDDLFTVGDRTWKWTGSVWITVEEAVVGPSGFVASDSEPTSTDVLWLDTDEEPDVPVPAGGSAGQVLSKVNATDYNTQWTSLPETPSGNAIINGAFDIWQRGTSFIGVGVNPYTYQADRFRAIRGATVGGIDVSREPAALDGFEYALKMQRQSGDRGTQLIGLDYALETKDSLPLVGKTVTLSFYAKCSAGFPGDFSARIATGTGVDQTFLAFTGFTVRSTLNATLTTTWQRFTTTTTIPTGVTQIGVDFSYNPTGTAGADEFFFITGVQLEAGTVATPFRRNAPSIQAELAACQRYYWRSYAASNSTPFTLGQAYSSTNGLGYISFPVTMRTNPTALEQTGTAANYGVLTANTTSNACTAVPLHDKSSTSGASFVFISSGLVAGNVTHLVSRNDLAYLGWSAEL